MEVRYVEEWCLFLIFTKAPSGLQVVWYPWRLSLFLLSKVKLFLTGRSQSCFSLLASLDLSTQKHPLLFEATAHWTPGLCLGPGLQPPYGVVTILLHCSAGGDGKEQGSVPLVALRLHTQPERG